MRSGFGRTWTFLLVYLTSFPCFGWTLSLALGTLKIITMRATKNTRVRPVILMKNHCERSKNYDLRLYIWNVNGEGVSARFDIHEM